ncbi:M20/M25/M40 family metallo-hydrolase [Ruegeria sp. 2205SS24-7]|uniref:M20/M25/M40 family metallo-hydrolase n=1 Tax=Ruegeria discodermiae TaxID=3064389 RepID=UPI002740CE91|nr:M20/M25/M40 family metallo-hydrolase [Ruegeria sp. 2205SS24-7]MDP5220386.1 M20/M25/M40 family metallo-hydrolase [Ruegeria sp. 2205SS24-7]
MDTTLKLESTTSQRDQAVEHTSQYLRNGGFEEDLSKLVAFKTETASQGDIANKRLYLETIIAPVLEELGFIANFYPNPDPSAGPLAIYTLVEDESLPTVLMYGHGDVVPGLEGQWEEGRSPWVLSKADGKLFGRGTADNKGQHWINISAIKAVYAVRGRLGFNCKILLETEEESGSPGLEAFCRDHREELLADVLIASDGPRIRTDRPTIALGARGNFNFDMSINYRESGRHSGNWGGLIKDPGIRLAHAIASIADERGSILVKGWRPEFPSNRIRDLLSASPLAKATEANGADGDWGESELTPAERVYAWNNFAVLAAKLGYPEKPVNAIAPRAWARCQLRFLAGLETDAVLPALREHLDERGFLDVEVTPSRSTYWQGTSTDPDNPWVQRVARSIAATEGTEPDLIPGIGGSLPNHAFYDLIGMPTIWIPHSYNECSQHAPNEHIRLDITESALKIMTGVFWDIGSENSGGA